MAMSPYINLRDLSATPSKRYNHTEAAFAFFEAHGITTIDEFVRHYKSVAASSFIPAEAKALVRHVKEILKNRQKKEVLNQPVRAFSDGSAKVQAKRRTMSAPAAVRVPRLRVPLSLLVQQYPNLEVEVDIL